MHSGHAIGDGHYFFDSHGRRTSGGGDSAPNKSIGRSLLPDSWRAPASIMLLLALALGATLRFFRLGARELSIDESLSWAESAGQTVADVVRVQHELDSGKFPIYELAQHLWIKIFSESEAALRALPALFGSFSILLVFILSVEVMLALSSVPPSSPATIGERESDGIQIYMVSAVCALLFAVGLPSVEIAREARMYSMMLAWMLVQIIFLLRARRIGGLANYAGTALFSALAIATNFTAVLVIAAEGLWIVYLGIAAKQPDRDRSGKTPLLIGAALVAAILLLMPFFAGLLYGVQGVSRGDYNWINPPGRWEPLATFESGLGSWPFPLFALFAILGGVRLWRAHRDEAVLLLLWLALPPVVLFIGSYLITPMLVTRYLISSFVPLFVLTAIGIDSLPVPSYRTGAVIALVVLSLIRVSSTLRPDDGRLRNACEVALANAGPERRVGAYRGYYLVRYYLRKAQRQGVQVVRIPLHAAPDAPRVVVVSQTATPAQVAQISHSYPVLVARFKNVMVMTRPAAGS
jgi:4-amino-4-deoxy-L-arabinose transferase-like glycosyltransferase